ncbi:sugar porter family MFS transporter [Dactylosporangium sp. NBC_01737]|uniref:sugar porter family MFS transporter n=1 Tax=Dactylosporangium sp. NBC_01737 TaxID=2975959 RepID=UPI002E135E57|nr:sugar porter family MFS transporter [Dactylosporangium sp. NBC_01737]
MAATESGQPHDAKRSNRGISRWLVLVAAVVMLAGLLFGYDQGVISGALRGIESTFRVSTLVIEIVTSWVTLGALVGALGGGTMTDRFGRRRTVLAAAVLFVLGAAIESAAPSTWVLVVGRLVAGVGVGVASVAAPLYAAEMAPARLRGRFVSLYQLMITFGIFVAYLVDQLLSVASGSWWRLMLGLSVVPGLLLLVAMLPLPDSPVWYLKTGQRGKAQSALRRVQPDADHQRDIASIEASLQGPQPSWGEVFARRWRAPLVLGLGLAVLQQFTGINGVIYYADTIFEAAGFDTPRSQTAATTWSIGAVNVLFTFVAVGYVDRFGRRPLLLAGLVGMGVSLLVISVCFLRLEHVAVHGASPGNAPSAAGVVTLVAMMVFIASFAFSLGPVVWTVINEIYPSTIRGLGVSAATAANWAAAWLVTQFFLSLTDWIGESGTFAVFAGMCVVSFGFVWKLLPETKGRTLGEIQQMWVDRAGSGRPS